MGSSWVRTTYEVTDGAGYIWDIYSDGRFYDGTSDHFDGAADVYGIGSFTWIRADTTAQIFEIPEYTTYSGLMSTRQIYVSPVDGFARVLDTFTNTSASAVTYTYSNDTDLGTDSATVYMTSSGDAATSTADTWVVGYAGSGSDTQVSGILYGNNTATVGSGISTSYDDVSFEMSVTINPGESVSFLSYYVQGYDTTTVATTLAGLADLPAEALEGLTNEQLETVVNWDLPETAMPAGTDKADLLLGTSAVDVIEGQDGNDLIMGAGGNDIVTGGYGADSLFGGAGDDVLIGGVHNGNETTYSTTTLASGEHLAISLTAPDAANGTTALVSGFVSREQVTSDNVDMVFVIDISGSAGYSFSGAVNVGDVNGDGYSNTILDAEIASFESLWSAITVDANLPNANITIIAFDDSASISTTFVATQDSDADRTADVLEYVRSLRDAGGTDYEEPLAAAYSHFSNSTAGQQLLYFLSDGANGGSTSSFSDEVAALLNLGVRIQSFGVGSGASQTHLDLVDDGIANNSTTIVLDPSLLSEELLDPGITAADITGVEIWLNGVLTETIDPADLTITPFGLRYFELELTGLNASADDQVEVRVTANDGTSTTISTSQTIENLVQTDKGDLLSGGEGHDTLYGEEGDDVLIGGAGLDWMDGGSGSDTASYIDAESRVFVNLLNGRMRGDARGDTLVSIENLTGSAYDDTLIGNNARNVLHGAGGNDILSGKGGSDVFVFEQGDGMDIITDFARKGRAERIDLSDFDYKSLKALKKDMTQVGSDVEIDLGNGDLLMIENITIRQFQANDFYL